MRKGYTRHAIPAFPPLSRCQPTTVSAVLPQDHTHCLHIERQGTLQAAALVGSVKLELNNATKESIWIQPSKRKRTCPWDSQP